MAAPMVPDHDAAYEELLTTRMLAGESVRLPVAGKRTDGKPDYSRIFARDLLTAQFLMSSDDERESVVLRYLAANQGVRRDSMTGEEPGKIFHENPGVSLRGRDTLFAACDTTALFLIGCARYLARTGDATFALRLFPSMVWSFGYIRAHLEDGLFLEDPISCGDVGEGRHYALRATYLRDGGIPVRRGKQLEYPVAYLLVQAQVVAALRSLQELFASKLLPEALVIDVKPQVDVDLFAAREAFRHYFDSAEPPVAVEGERRTAVPFVCTDPAIALWYLEPDEVTDAFCQGAQEYLVKLATPWGWKGFLRDPANPAMRRERETIWPADQAFCAEGLERHGLKEGEDIALRAAKALVASGVPFTEYLLVREQGKPAARGCRWQLWTVAFWRWCADRLARRSAS